MHGTAYLWEYRDEEHQICSRGRVLRCFLLAVGGSVAFWQGARSDAESIDQLRLFMYTLPHLYVRWKAMVSFLL